MSGSAKTLIVLVGPTAVGKTALSIEIAKELNCEILSTDSRQFYREMTIGTAQPTKEELSQVKHHFIDSLSIHDHYTAGIFEEESIRKLDQLFDDSDFCVAVGGSGLYINALCYGIDDIPADEDIRNKLLERLENEGLEKLQEEVKRVDPSYYEEADMQNPRRVFRALEVFEITGKTLTSYRSKPKKERNFNIIWIGLEMDVEQLYQRINLRVDKMMEEGLLDEVKSLHQYKELKTLRTVGYQELFEYFDGKISLEEAVELVKRNSRRFAKKQFTWFRKNPEIKWFNSAQKAEILAYIQANK